MASTKNVTQDTEEETVEASPKLGELLITSREKKRWSRKDIAEYLRLAPKVIEILETEQFERSQRTLFIKGYLRAYARAVEIDPELIIEIYETQHLAPLEDPLLAEQTTRTVKPEPVKAANAPVVDRSDSDKHRTRTLFLLLTLFAVGLLWFAQRQSWVQLSLSPMVDMIDFAKVKPAPEPTETVVGPPTTSAADASEHATVASADSSEKLDLLLKDDSWVTVRDARQNRLLTGMMSRGKSIHIQGEAPFHIVLGKPQAVEVTFEGAKIDTSRYPASRVAKLTLGEKQKQ